MFIVFQILPILNVENFILSRPKICKCRFPYSHGQGQKRSLTNIQRIITICFITTSTCKTNRFLPMFLHSLNLLHFQETKHLICLSSLTLLFPSLLRFEPLFNKATALLRLYPCYFVYIYVGYHQLTLIASLFLFMQSSCRQNACFVC